ncbi:hypothetical protein [Pseudoalteromonas sp. R3]|uniref:hypothetical protein n=1 Tax=Pseudoalteromonas sp. R3 TaxID=1709477 RepID=UPI000AE2EFC1|nr:hypothetical protein [Pseudoalteromonas sp. R3]AZZ97613.1 hypothetical protein ELR70_11070 [Pseudoalteromonas sp. R3]
MKIVLPLLTLVFLSGCNTTSSERNADSGDTAKAGYRCKQVTALGSNIPNVYCSTKKQREEAAQRGIEATRTSQRVGRITGGNGS